MGALQTAGINWEGRCRQCHVSLGFGQGRVSALTLTRFPLPNPFVFPEFPSLLLLRGRWPGALLFQEKPQSLALSPHAAPGTPALILHPSSSPSPQLCLHRHELFPEWKLGGTITPGCELPGKGGWRGEGSAASFPLFPRASASHNFVRL